METKLIGKGAFSRAYLLESGRVLLRSCCPIKECMALGWFPDSPLFPVLGRVDYGVYEMEFYPKVSSLKNSLDEGEYEIYRTLKRLSDSRPFWERPDDAYHAWYKVFDSELIGDLRDTMISALEACANMGSDIGFEISPRNIAVKDGKLVLLDVFFSIGKLLEVRDKKPVSR
jgi:hypothetical protein